MPLDWVVAIDGVPDNPPFEGASPPPQWDLVGDYAIINTAFTGLGYVEVGAEEMNLTLDWEMSGGSSTGVLVQMLFPTVVVAGEIHEYYAITLQGDDTQLFLGDAAGQHIADSPYVMPSGRFELSVSLTNTGDVSIAGPGISGSAQVPVTVNSGPNYEPDKGGPVVAILDFYATGSFKLYGMKVNSGGGGTPALATAFIALDVPLTLDDIAIFNRALAPSEVAKL